MFKIYIIHPNWLATSKRYPVRRVQSEREKRSYWVGTCWGAKRYGELFEFNAARAELERIQANGFNSRFSSMADANYPQLEEIKLDQST